MVVQGPLPPLVDLPRERVPNPDVAIDPHAPWQFERLVLRDGTAYQGLLLAAGLAEAEFAEIRRPPGRRMAAMVRVIPRRDVLSFESLAAGELDVLAARFRALRQRASIEARRMESIELVAVEAEAGTRWRYDGRWFQLVSTADGESTRRCVVKIEQMFQGFRQLVPPRTKPVRPLQIVLLGTRDEFQGQLRRWALELTSPAFYSPTKNLIVAGGDLSHVGNQLARIRREHVRLLGELETLAGGFPGQLAAIRRELSAAGFAPEEIRAELELRRIRWRAGQARLRREIRAANRRNDGLFAAAAERMLRQLYHEAFHAYLENFVFPQHAYVVDRWLNEGLAQIFENAQFDVDVLRLDAPDPVLLARLQRELASAQPWPLARMLAAEDAAFTARHAADDTDKHYLYAWGVAYYLAFERDLLGGEALSRYVRSRQDSTADHAAASPAVGRFELLVDDDLEHFEQRWREYMLRLHVDSD